MNDRIQAWGDQPTQFFYQLTPDKILDAIESSLELRCTGRSFAHNSMENRVYELEIEMTTTETSAYDRFRIVKFYRPGRWSRDQILEEHRFLGRLREDDIPVVAPLVLKDGETLHTLKDLGLHYCVFPKVGGRAPHELTDEQLAEVGRLLARMHNVGATMEPASRVKIDATSYGSQHLEFLLSHSFIPSELADRFKKVVGDLCDYAEPLFSRAEAIQLHGDCHLGNLLWRDRPFWVDFDDSVIGPPVQDLWLMILGRDEIHRDQMNKLLRAYELMREFDWDTLDLIEPLRALRMIHFISWTAKRYEDPAFQNAFPDFGQSKYWHEQIRDLESQWEVCQSFRW